MDQIPESLNQRMFDAGVRVEQMWWVGGICTYPPHEFDEWIEDELPDATEILKEFPWMAEPNGIGEDICAELAIRRINGFFVQLATPIPKDFHKDGNGFSFSWGHYRTEWFFFCTLDALVDRAEKWAEEVIESARKKAAA